MSTFTNAVRNQTTRTTNGMVAQVSTAKRTVDLFYKIGASRGKNIVPDFVAAFAENPDHALRIAAWSRDVRGGAGERKLFRDILTYLEKNNPDAAKALARKVPELGRWDDLLVFTDAGLKHFAFDLIRDALDAGNGLTAKWMPRKGSIAVELRDYFGWTPKFYRKRLVELTKVVENQMCANDWDNINFNHVPSVASSRYKKAFARHTQKYSEWTTALVSTDPAVKATVKVNASAVYPYDVLKGIGSATRDQANHIKAQWDALPDYVGDAAILPLIDVSGSMGFQVSPGLSALDVAVSIGLYLADKNKGKFKDTFLTFSTVPQLLNLQGDILQKVQQMSRASWDMSTNIEGAFKKILEVAINGKVPQSEMPEYLLIVSDMQFDLAVHSNQAAIDMIEARYTAAGYEVPKIVFWNINAHSNAPVSYNKTGVALVSGFSPAITRTVLSADLEKFTPESVMLETILKPRYDL